MNILTTNKQIIDDESLVIAIIKDDKDAFKKLYYKYFPFLIRFCWYRTFSMDLSKDFVQELFTKIWIVRQKLDPKKSIKAYLYKSLSNMIANYFKSNSSRSLQFDESIPNYNAGNNNYEMKFDIKKALDELPEKSRVVFMLSRYDGFDYSEIAEICSISKKAVEKRMSKAFLILRKKFPEKYFNS